MKTLLLLLLSVGLATASELTDLQAKYNKAILKATDPITKVYVQELQKMIEKESKSGNLDQVTIISDEIKRVAQQYVSVRTPISIEKLFVKKTWKTSSGTSFTFLEDGQGYRQFGSDKTILVWKLDKGVVEVQAQITEKGAIKKWYFLFIDKNTARYGDSISEISSALSSN